jgi:ABC-type hemin transport system ATPase subunit
MLKIDNLHVRVAGRDILKGLSLTVAPGQVHAIMGPNGAGKSTLANVLAGATGMKSSRAPCSSAATIFCNSNRKNAPPPACSSRSSIRSKSRA